MIDKFDGTKYAFLSNFYMCPIWYDGILYPSSEHAYQASKSTNFAIRKLVANLKTPAESKKVGKQIQMRDDWDKIKVSIMREIVAIKFLSNPKLLTKLMATGNEKLEYQPYLNQLEGNTWGDQFWGVCNGVGENWLGTVLMDLRDRIANCANADFLTES